MVNLHMGVGAYFIVSVKVKVAVIQGLAIHDNQIAVEQFG